MVYTKETKKTKKFVLRPNGPRRTFDFRADRLIVAK